MPPIGASRFSARIGRAPGAARRASPRSSSTCARCARAYALCPACGGLDDAEDDEDIDDDDGRRIVEFWVECTACGRRMNVVGRENGSVLCDCGADCRYLPELTRWATQVTVSVADLHDFIASAAHYCPTCPEEDRVAYVETWDIAQFFAGPDVSADTRAKPGSAEDLPTARE